MMKFCYECGTALIQKINGIDGPTPYCPCCQTFRFPIFSTAVSMIVKNPAKDKILLIKQYGKPHYVLVAGYINKGENAENTVVREVKEEIGLNIVKLHPSKSAYFAPTNTLMLNFACVADSEDLSGTNNEIDSAAWFSLEEAVRNIKPDSLAEYFLIYHMEQYKHKTEV